MEDWVSLQGVQIVSTRPKGASTMLRRLVEDCGWGLIEMPMIETKPHITDETLQGIHELKGANVIVTSANAIRSLRAIIGAAEAKWPPDDTKWYCISHGTERVAKENGLFPVVFENVKTGLEFAEVLAPCIQNPQNKNIFVRGQKADSGLVSRLNALGIQVSQQIVYDTVDVQVDVSELVELNQKSIVVYALFSPSAVESLIKQWPDFNRCRTERTIVVTIGQTTASACKARQIQIDGVANRPNEAALVEKVQEIIAPILSRVEAKGE